MSSQQLNKEIVKKLSAFVLSPGSIELRNEIYDFLVILSLYDEKDVNGSTITSIVNSIKEELAIEEVPIALITYSIERLVKKGIIISKESVGRYVLSDEYKKYYDDLHKMYDNILEYVHSELHNKLKNKIMSIDDVLVNDVIRVFDEFLAVVFSQISIETCSEILISKEKIMDVDVNAYDILNNMLKYFKYKSLIRETIIEYIHNPDEYLKDYLYSLSQTYFCIGILQLDPDCSKYIEDSLKNKTIYLDTNIIYHSLVRTDKRSKATNYALKLCQDLNINLIITKRTKQEYLNMLKYRKTDLKKLDKIPIKRYNKVSTIIDKGLMSDYYESKKSRIGLSVDSYFTRLEEFITILGNLYGVVYDDEEHDEIYGLEFFNEAFSCVMKASDRYYMFKSENTVNHDAYHILLVQELRKSQESDALGPNSWFLTNDGSLTFAEKCMGNDLKSNILTGSFIQLVSPFLVPAQEKTMRDAYVTLFSSRLPLATNLIDENDFLMLQGDWIDDDGLYPEDIARIIGNNYVKKYLKEIKDTNIPISEEDLSKALGPLIEEIKINRSLNKETQEKLSEQGSKIDEQSGTIIDLSEKTTVLETTVNTLRDTLNKFSYILGTVIWAAVFLFSYLYLFVSESNNFWYSIILATIIGYSLGFPVYRALLNQLLSKKNEIT